MSFFLPYDRTNASSGPYSWLSAAPSAATYAARVAPTSIRLALPQLKRSLPNDRSRRSAAVRAWRPLPLGNRPPQCTHCSISMPNTRFRRRAQFMRMSRGVGRSWVVAAFAPPASSSRRDRRSQPRMRGEHSMKPRQVYPRQRHQRRQPGDDVQGLEHDVTAPVVIAFTASGSARRRALRKRRRGRAKRRPAVRRRLAARPATPDRADTRARRRDPGNGPARAVVRGRREQPAGRRRLLEGGKPRSIARRCGAARIGRRLRTTRT
jgi:hypothetical protein